MNLIETIILWTAYLISLYFSFFLVLVFLEKKEFFENEEQISLNNSSNNIFPNLIAVKKPIVTVIIPAYNEEKTILNTIKSTLALDYPTEKLEIIVVNDGSTDNTLEVITNFQTSLKQNSNSEKNFKSFKILSHKNMGKAASMNKALNLAKGEFFACLDADSFVDPKSLLKMLNFYYGQDDPKLAIVTPAMKVHKPSNVLQKIQWFEYLIMIFVGRLTSHLDSLYVAPGPFSLYKTKVIQELNGFDEKTLTEDQEIAYRIQKQQLKIKQCFNAYVYTTAPNKLLSFYQQRRRWYLGSMQCAYQYKQMIANKKYGDFGIMQMLKNVVGYFLALSGIAFGIYFIIWPTLQWLSRAKSVGFNFFPYLSNLKLSLSPLLLDIQFAIVFLILLAVSIFFFLQAHKNAKEKVNILSYVPIFSYFLFYYLLKGGILLLSMFEFVSGRKIKW